MKTIALLLSIFLLILACDTAVPQGEVEQDNRRIKLFTLEPLSILQNEVFTVKFDIKIGFDISIRIRKKNTTDNGSIIYYSTATNGYLSNLSFDYANGKITMDKTVTNISVTPDDYEVFLQLCDLIDSKIECFDSHTLPITLLKKDALVLDFEFYLKTIKPKLFSKSSLSKTQPIFNKSSMPKNYAVQLYSQNPKTDIFNYNFNTHSLGVFTIPALSYDNLSISPNATTLNTKDNLSISEKFIIAADNKSKVYTSNITVVSVAEESCKIENQTPCDDIVFKTTESVKTAALLFDIDIIRYLKSINAKLTFEDSFFEKFESDNRTSCIIFEDKITAKYTLLYDSECYLFLTKKSFGDAILTISGYDSSNPNILPNRISRTLIFSSE